MQHLQTNVTGDLVLTCLDRCRDSGSGCNAQSLLPKIDHGLIAPLFGLHNVLIDFLQGDIQSTFIADTLIKFDHDMPNNR